MVSAASRTPGEPAEMNEQRPKPSLRPRDAATLVLYRRRGGQLEVLMGERHGGHAFMPNRYVFPGGRVDPTDWRVRAAGEVAPMVAERLCRSCRPSRARALAAAAVRETFEETGLILGRPDPAPGAPVPANWQDFFATGMAPALDLLDYVYRAVTPPSRPRRFDARFFAADADHLAGAIRGSGELLDLRWLSVEDALRLELPNITGILLRELDGLLTVPAKDRRVPVRYFRRGVEIIEEE